VRINAVALHAGALLNIFLLFASKSNVFIVYCNGFIYAD